MIARVSRDLMKKIAWVAMVASLSIKRRSGTVGRRPDDQTALHVESQVREFGFPAVLFMCCQKQNRKMALNPLPQNIDDVCCAHEPCYRSSH